MCADTDGEGYLEMVESSYQPEHHAQEHSESRRSALPVFV